MSSESVQILIFTEWDSVKPIKPQWASNVGQMTTDRTVVFIDHLAHLINFFQILGFSVRSAYKFK